VNVQNRANLALALLPPEVAHSGLTIRKKSAALLQIINIYSPKNTYDVRRGWQPWASTMATNGAMAATIATLSWFVSPSAKCERSLVFERFLGNRVEVKLA
jgi:hypothetical protein